MKHSGFIETIRRNGIVPLASLWPGEVAELRRHLEGCEVYNAHVQAKATEPPAPFESAPPWPMMCHRMEDVVVAPHLFENALRLIPFVQRYFDGEAPLLYSMNAFWTQPAPGAPEYLDTHGWHRDGDDRKQVVMFVYGTDVNVPADGAHLYQMGTHRIADADLGRDFREPPPDGVQTVLGSRGRAFLADTGGLHLGLRPKTGRRMLAWARFGVTDPPASYVWDGLSPIPRAMLGSRYPSDPALQEAVRLIVR